jgi:DNA-binding XRE family transcriptional regulator
MDQAQLASAANISLGAIKNIESGKGFSMKPLVKLALDAEQWLGLLSPATTVNPMQSYEIKILICHAEGVYLKRGMNAQEDE